MKSNRTRALLFLFLLAFLISFYQAAAEAADESFETILTKFTADYQNDPNAKDETFGIQVDGEMWTVQSNAAKGDQAARVTLEKKDPPYPTYFFTLDRATLLKLDQGKLNAKTAMAKAFSTDFAPMDISAMDGFQPPGNFTAQVLSTTFHFWTRGLPEIIPFGDGLTRFTHGADITVFYYQPGLRTGWASLKKGMHANKDPKSQVNEFPTLVIAISGKGIARIGGKELIFQDGQSIFIPKGVAHEFWNESEQPLEIILIMFGEGA